MPPQQASWPPAHAARTVYHFRRHVLGRPLEHAMTVDTRDMIFRSVYVDPDVDRTLRQQAKQAGTPASEMFRRYLQRGMTEFREGARRAALPKGNAPLALRTVFVPVDVDEELRVQAFHLRTSKSKLMRQVLWMGMLALHAE
jgi:hypothetical protein